MQGDVLLVQSGHIGHSAVVPKDHEGHNCHSMIVITPIKDAMSGPFLSLCFNTSEMRSKFEHIRSGSTVPHLTCGEVREIVIPTPDLETQRRVVEQSEQVQNETVRLGSVYQRKIAALEALKNSFLHQAFAGKL
jgi:type I restriction enzyme S subunit